MKIVDIKNINGNKDGESELNITSQALLDAMSQFVAYSMDKNIKSFAAVAVTAEGDIIDTWSSEQTPISSLLGAIELLKRDFLEEHY